MKWVNQSQKTKDGKNSRKRLKIPRKKVLVRSFSSPHFRTFGLNVGKSHIMFSFRNKMIGYSSNTHTFF